MPRIPSDLNDPGEIAATNEIEQQLVALDQPTRAAGFDVATECPIAAVVAGDSDARKRNPVFQIDADTAALFLDITKPRVAASARIEICQMIAKASTTAAAGQHFLPPLRIRRHRLVICPALRLAALMVRAIAHQLAMILVTTVLTWNGTQCVANGFAHVIKLIMLAPARINNGHSIPVLFGVVNAELPAVRCFTVRVS